MHQRLALVGTGAAVQTAVARLAELVRPGGWIQLIEAENVIDENDGPAMHDFLKLMKDIFTTMGANVKLAGQLHGWLEALGFRDVHERLVNVYMGARNTNPQLAQQGVRSTSIAAGGLVDFAKSQSPTRTDHVFPWKSPEALFEAELTDMVSTPVPAAIVIERGTRHFGPSSESRVGRAWRELPAPDSVGAETTVKI